jgi:hypothetical protein
LPRRARLSIIIHRYAFSPANSSQNKSGKADKKIRENKTAPYITVMTDATLTLSLSRIGLALINPPLGKIMSHSQSTVNEFCETKEIVAFRSSQAGTGKDRYGELGPSEMNTRSKTKYDTNTGK